MTKIERDAVLATELNYVTIDNRLLDLLARCNDETDPNKRSNMKRQLVDAHQEALRNWVEAQNRILSESENLVRSITDAAKSAQKEIDDTLQDIKDIKETLNTLTLAVKSVASVVAKLT